MALWIDQRAYTQKIATQGSRAMQLIVAVKAYAGHEKGFKNGD
jgi:hypothetical protein